MNTFRKRQDEIINNYRLGNKEILQEGNCNRLGIYLISDTG